MIRGEVRPYADPFTPGHYYNILTVDIISNSKCKFVLAQYYNNVIVVS